LCGEFEVWLRNQGHWQISSGDSLDSESAMPHCRKNPGRLEAWILWGNTPATF
jgi:hypothetical protein